jgi:hypothetical protein
VIYISAEIMKTVGISTVGIGTQASNLPLKWLGMIPPRKDLVPDFWVFKGRRV